MVQGMTQAKGIPTVRMGKAAWFWRGEKNLVVWKRAVPPGPGGDLWTALFSSTDIA